MNKKEIISYNTDASRLMGNVQKVVFPENLESVQNVVKTANLDIVPRGAGTSFLGGTIPNNSVVVDMNKMNKIIDLDRKKNMVYIEAGISIKELNEKLNYVGFEFPIRDINDSSTLGGMVARNISDARSMKYGRIKEWVEEIEFVNGRGELMKTSKADLADVCGMEGITGIIVNVKLRIIPLIKRSVSIFQTDSLEEILSIGRRLKLEKDVVMLEVFSKQTSQILNFPNKYNLIIEFDSDRGKIRGEEYNKIMNLRKKLYYNLYSNEYFQFEDVKFFFDKLNEFISYLEVNQIPYVAYLGNGVIYYFFKDNEDEKRKQVIEILRKMSGKFITGTGIKRKGYVDSFEKKIINRVKLRHDPFGKLNKGKIIDFEAKISAGRHFEPLRKEEVEGIGTILEEQKEFDSQFKEKGELHEGFKTPEEKMEEFINKVEKKEAVKISDSNEKITEKSKQDPYSAQALLKDYEETYDSELEEERRKNVEDFARNVAGNVSHLKQELKRNPATVIRIEEPSKDKISREDITGLKSKPKETITPQKQKEKSITSQKESYEEPGHEESGDVEINKPKKEYKIEDPNVEKRGKLSKDEEDEINKVLFGGK